MSKDISKATKLAELFQSEGGKRFSLNFRRQLSLASDMISAQLPSLHARYEGVKVTMAPACEDDFAQWDAWDTNKHLRSFHWRQLAAQDKIKNEKFTSRALVAIRVDGKLCGFTHFIVSGDFNKFVITHIESLPDQNPLRGAVTFCTYQAALTLAKNFGCEKLWTCGPVYSPVLEHQLRALNFNQFDDGQTIHYVRHISPTTFFTPDMFKRPFPRYYAPAP